ncbi:MAG: SAM-dependent methyltransferase [Rhodobacteraceae bacterium]|nr:SAM-dependent methyltransferase [Paracoccaceae bacterium]
MTVAETMAECLLHPEHGYYATRDPFGQGGDFTTAPEISQMFGELIGLALAQVWLDQGAPSPVALVELGPGRGTLMADILRATRAVPGFHAAVQVHLVEASATLRRVQAETVAPTRPDWHDTAETLPDLPSLIVANEFFDALPIRQFQRAGGAWRERMVGVRDGALTFGLSDPAPVGVLAHRLADTEDGDLVEICPAAGPIAETLARRVVRGGALLVIDYGGWHSRGDTLQAIKNHAPVPPLTDPGDADLTAHVDFEPLAAVARTVPGLQASPLVPQGVFLERLGITPRAQALAARLTGAALESHIAAHRRLTHPDEMGSLFKCLALLPQAAAPFPGLTQ